MRFLFLLAVSICARVNAESPDDRYLSLPNLEKCNARFKEFQYDGRNYFYSGHDKELKDVKLDWLDSRNTCRERCMETVSFETQAEFDFIKEYIMKNEIKFIWTSGRLCDFAGCEGRWDLLPKIIKGWLWSANQKQIDPTNRIPTGWTYIPWSHTGHLKKKQPDNAEFFINQASESCLGVLNNQYNDSVTWHDIACYQKTGFICEDSPELFLEAQEMKSGSEHSGEVFVNAPERVETTTRQTTTTRPRPTTTTDRTTTTFKTTTTKRTTAFIPKAQQTTKAVPKIEEPVELDEEKSDPEAQETTESAIEIQQSTESSPQTTVTERQTTAAFRRGPKTQKAATPSNVFDTTVTSRFRGGRPRATKPTEKESSSTSSSAGFPSRRRTRPPTDAPERRASPTTTTKKATTTTAKTTTTTLRTTTTTTTEEPAIITLPDPEVIFKEENVAEKSAEPEILSVVEDDEHLSVKIPPAEEPLATTEQPAVTPRKVFLKRKKPFIKPKVAQQQDENDEHVSTERPVNSLRKTLLTRRRLPQKTQLKPEIKDTEIDSVPLEETTTESAPRSTKTYTFIRKKIYGKLKGISLVEKEGEHLDSSEKEDSGNLQKIDETASETPSVSSTTEDYDEPTRAIPIKRKKVKLYRKVIKFKPTPPKVIYDGPLQNIDDNYASDEHKATISPLISIRNLFKPKFRPSSYKYITRSHDE